MGVQFLSLSKETGVGRQTKKINASKHPLPHAISLSLSLDLLSLRNGLKNTHTRGCLKRIFWSGVECRTLRGQSRRKNTKKNNSKIEKNTNEDVEEEKKKDDDSVKGWVVVHGPRQGRKNTFHRSYGDGLFSTCTRRATGTARPPPPQWWHAARPVPPHVAHPASPSDQRVQGQGTRPEPWQVAHSGAGGAEDESSWMERVRFL